MRAWVRSAYGGPEVLRLTEVPVPVPGAGELLVRVHATTVNRTDLAACTGEPWVNKLVGGWPRPRQAVLGTEFAGVVTALGEGVTSYAVGDRVFGFVDGRPGSHAELVAVPADALLARIPDGWSFADAAPATEGAHYALAFLRVTRVAPGDRVLVHGATGAIGSAAVQLLAARGVEVTAVCDRLPEADPDLVARLGAVRVVDLRHETVGPADGPFDAVLDAAGKSSFGHYRPLLRPGGCYSSSDLGRGGQNPLLALAGPLLKPIFGGRRVRFPLPHGGAAVAAELLALMVDGAYRPVVDRTFDLEDLPDAYAYVGTGRKVGNVVVTVRVSAAG